ncbi:DUF4328 domain-containing protein [Marinimicrobium sp. ABcell2]|uniref:DUF4328 domain-containing protein n=1 Tax=Marinimicrobium sp. ABcell2 TaxID=3069751 RepID=UPI0027B627F0|nr:DUF4328 domain-containing protein [Marinimicrobium sp. ABcell2]MDQ2076382.1 DUF4328 domain-containing protein [Marinimicrobium sp. ABcell2]
MSIEQTGSFKDPTHLTNWTLCLLYALVVAAVIALISGMLEYQLLSDFQEGVYASQELAIAAGEASDARQRLVAIVQLAIFIVAGVLTLMWIYRANYNARQLGASGMEFTPGWSIGWYFIPLANLWMPYQAMREIWKASRNPQDWRGATVSPLLPWWWFFWIALGVLGHASYRLTMRAEELSEFITANVVAQISGGSDIVLTLILIAIIHRVHRMQMAHANSQKNTLDSTDSLRAQLGLSES